MDRKTYEEMTALAREYYKKAAITVREDEEIEVADFNLGMAEKVGLSLCVYVNTKRVCAKEMVLLPYQTFPEHKHVISEFSTMSTDDTDVFTDKRIIRETKIN